MVHKCKGLLVGVGVAVLLALPGLVIAVAGALAPAGWAARTRTATALRTVMGGIGGRGVRVDVVDTDR